MKLSIDATGLGGAKTGTAVYLLEILRVWNNKKDLSHRFVIYISAKTKHYFDDLCLDKRFILRAAPDNRPLRILWQQLVLPFELIVQGCDVHWGAGFILPLLSKRKAVVSIHDITFQLFPEVHERSKRWYFPWMIGQAVRKARRIIVISETTKRDLAALYPEAAAKTIVTMLAARPLDTRDKQGSSGGAISGPYVLAIGTLEPRKNIPRLIEAWLGVPREVRGKTRLLIAGARGWMDKDLQGYRSLEEMGVQFLGFVEEKVLGNLLNGALALTYPSLYEGFGLPVVEAMAMGVPVLTSAIGATAEVAGDAALLVDPTSVKSIRQGIERILTDDTLRQTLSKKGFVRASSFSWEGTASDTLTALEQVFVNP